MKTGLFFRIGSIHYSLQVKEDITAYESAILAEFLTMYTPDRILDIDGKAEFINERMAIIGRHFHQEIKLTGMEAPKEIEKHKSSLASRIVAFMHRGLGA